VKTPPASTPPASPRAPLHPGALLLCLLAFLASSCEQRRPQTPEWQSEPPQSEPAPSAKPPPAPEPEPTPEPTPEPDPEPGPEAASPPPPPPSELRFVAYNLRNYFTASLRRGDRTEAPKPEKAIQALVSLLASARPDVLGLCEIGSPADLADLQRRLAAAGLDLPHTELASGADEHRRMALVSRHPIARRDSPNPPAFRLKGQTMRMRRGILDATVAAGNHSFRFLGVHLKSKRETPEADQELMRRNEAWILRQRADAILAKDPDTLLCVYGDFNDTRRSTTLRAIKGPYRSPRFLAPLPLADSRGDLWTHFWDDQHVYSRFDYILVNKPLEALVAKSEGRLLDAPEWRAASDHRPLLAVFRWKPPP